jgi:hypothetical protein
MRNADVPQIVLVVVLVLVLDFLGNLSKTCSVEALIEHDNDDENEND